MSSVTDCQLKVLHKEIFLQMAFKLINCTKQSVLNFHSSHYKISIQTSKPLQKKNTVFCNTKYQQPVYQQYIITKFIFKTLRKNVLVKLSVFKLYFNICLRQHSIFQDAKMLFSTVYTH